MPPDRPLRARLWDRLVFGAISGAFGAVFGVAAGLLAAMLFRTSAALVPVVIFSGGYFFCVGALRGADAAFVVGEGLHVAEMAVRAQARMVPEPKNDETPGTWRAPALLVIWLAFVGTITCFW